MKNFKFQLALIATSVLLASCGGGGNSSGNPDTGLFNPEEPEPTVAISGLAADGYLIGATVCLDLNENKACDAGEPSAETQAPDGSWTIDEGTQEQVDNFPIVLIADPATTTDTDTDAAVAGEFVLTAPAGSEFVSPLTSLVQALVEAGTSTADAISQIEGDFADLGITSWDADYIEEGNDDVHLAAQVITQVLIDTFETLGDDQATVEAALEVAAAEVDEVVTIISTTDFVEGTTGADVVESENLDITAQVLEEADDATVIISGSILEDMTLSAGTTYVLDGVVTVGAGNVNVATQADVDAIKAAGVTLTVEAGADVRGASDGALIVTRGSKLIAEGTAENPITFSSLDDDYDGLGEWGGIVIQGFAPQYGAGGTGACFGAGVVCNVEGEGGTEVAVYGGNDPADDSGSLRYVRIAEGGLVAGPNNEVNGLTLQGVGHATDLEYIQVHGNLDDGIEWFGGTANLKYAVLTNNDDDSLDYDEGYQGNIQYAIIQMDQEADAPQGSNDPRGIEANSSDDEYVPETDATIANVLVIAGPLNNTENGSQPGMRLRGALTTAVYNTAVKGFDTGCIRIDDADTDLDGSVDTLSDVTLVNVFGECEDGLYDKRDADTAENAVETTVTLDTAYALVEFDAELGQAVDIPAVDNGSGFTFDSTDYVGAVAPGTAQADAWWAGWTIPGSLTEEEIVDEGDLPEVIVSGTITEDTTFSSSNVYILDGVVTVGEGSTEVNSDADVDAIKAAGVTLTIEAGTTILAESDGVLYISRGSKIDAQGTATSPITFASRDEGYDGLGEWGGVIIAGFAPQYGAGGTGACYGSGTTCNVEGEGGDEVGSVFGGNDPADDSGVMRYVRIAEGGRVAGPNNEVNGLTLQGVGYGTTLEYIQVHNNLDDGIEWFGGTVDIKYAVLTGNDDDSLDYDEGYKGNIQHVIIQMNQELGATPTGSNDPRGIEANSSDDEYVPETEAAIANVTIIAGDNNNVDGSEQPGMRLRGALTTAIYNSAVQGFSTGCIRIDDADTDLDGSNDEFSDVTLVNVIGDCIGDGFYDKRDADTETGIIGESVVTIDDAYAVNEVQARLDAATTITKVENGGLFEFDETNYIGAVAPGTDPEDAWWAGWTIEGSLDKPVNTPDTSPEFVTCDSSFSQCELTGTIDEDYRITAGPLWSIDGVIFVGEGNVDVADDNAVQAVKDAGVTITIEAGVDIEASDDGVFYVTRGSKIMAMGEADEPITFSSDDPGYDGLGEWGGVIVAGFAPQYGAGGTGACFGGGTVCNVDGEGGSDVNSVFGGNDPADNSGVIRYVRIAEGGLVAGPNNEVNGLTLQGVGYETDIQYVQVHANQDDGIEWFGGTVDVKYAVLTSNDDDSLDYDEGYMGNIQYVIIQNDQTASATPTGSNDPRGIEANSSDDEYVPETNAALANITIKGGDINAGQPGMRLRGALTTSIYNTAVTGYTDECVRIDDADTDLSGSVDEFSDVTLVNVVGADCAAFYDHEVADTETGTVGLETSLTLDASYALTDSVATLDAPVAITEVASGSDFEFDDTDYIGAVEPGTPEEETWWSKWVIEGTLD